MEHAGLRPRLAGARQAPLNDDGICERLSLSCLGGQAHRECDDARVLVVNDSPSVRSGLARILASAGYAVQTFASARRGSAAASIVFFSRFADVPTAVEAIRRGAIDLLVRPVPTHVLLGSVEKAVAHARVQFETRRRLERLRGRYRMLTPREREVFALVTAGLLNKQVGSELGTSEKTVKTQRAVVVQKMGAPSLAALVRMADALSIRPSHADETVETAKAPVALGQRPAVMAGVGPRAGFGAWSAVAVTEVRYGGRD